MTYERFTQGLVAGAVGWAVGMGVSMLLNAGQGINAALSTTMGGSLFVGCTVTALVALHARWDRS